MGEPKEIALSREALDAGFQLLHVTRAESTNAAALAAVLHGADRFWLVADEQSAGRGRHGRTWASPPGNLYASIGLASPCSAAKAPLLGFVAGLSLAEAIVSLAPALKPAVQLKWPNDCLMAGEKCVGILLEGSNGPDGRCAVVIGMGVNVLVAPEGLDQPATSLARHSRAFTVQALFERLSARMAANLVLFADGVGFAAIRERWLEHAMAVGSPVRVKLPAGEITGAFAGIDGEGQLLVSRDGVVEAIVVGDVFPLGLGVDPEETARAG
ncbi:MAG TPA: biotin--[acetyl-CoA-carboxylase] ligase [Rhabdaerophilum sp.]|nr:biotin--[acetyl-CoA-carboxylase] ligase [Rhabdaerophilum sp.]